MANVSGVRQKFADQVIKSLNNGVVPWQNKDLPVAPIQSAISGLSYKGVNAFYLMEKCATQGFKDSRFITMSAANEKDVWVRKGESGVSLENWARGKDDKIEPRTYTVFNVEQLQGKLENLPEHENGRTENVVQMLKNAGIDIPDGSDVEKQQKAVKELVAKHAEEMNFRRDVHTPELLALRCNIASTLIMRETGIPVEQSDGLPMKSWASSIKHDSSQLYKAIRDGSQIAQTVVQSMTQEREAHLQQASWQRGEAQKAQEVIAEAVSIPRGADFNLPDADLSGTQETVVAAAQKASTQVNELRTSASQHEASANPSKLTEARAEAKKHLGSNAVVTSAQPGKVYSGKMIGVLGNGPDKTAIQVIADNRAVLHTIKDAAAKSALKIGDDINLSVDADGNSVVQEQSVEKAKKATLAREGMRR